MELELREHQIEVIEQLREGFRQGHRSQLLYAPTGFGKTEVAIYLMKATAEKYKRAAMVLDRIVLVDQTSLRLSKYHIKHGVFQADHPMFDKRHRLQRFQFMGCVQSLINFVTPSRFIFIGRLKRINN